MENSNEIRILIREVVGYMSTIDEIVKKIIRNYGLLDPFDGQKKEIKYNTKQDFDNFPIDIINIEISLKNTNNIQNKKIGGSFKDIKLIEGKVVAFISLRSLKELTEEEREEMKNVLTHELLHAYEFSKKREITPEGLNINNPAGYFKSMAILFPNQQMKKFCTCFYLSQPEEIRARIHEIVSIFLKHKDKSAIEIINAAKQHKIYKDIDMLSNFNKEEFFNNTTKQERESLLNSYKGFLKEKVTDKEKDENTFFNFYIDQYIKNGNEAKKKLISALYNIKNI